MKIAILEDDKLLLDMLCLWCTSEGHETSGFGTGKAFRKALVEMPYDLLIIDWNLPDTNGIEVIRWLRGALMCDAPVLVLTVKDREADIVTALDAGADDFMSKPAHEKELMARLRALGRRLHNLPAADELMAMPPYQIDTRTRSITVDGEAASLTNKEYELAVLLFQNPGRLLSRNFLQEFVWGTNAELNTRTVDTHISRIRSKLSIRPEQGWRLSSVYHRGYRLEHVGSTQLI